MTVEGWLQNAVDDADRRGLPELKPLLETLAHATRKLRWAALTEAADGSIPATPGTERPDPPAR